jgi:hypothetical protein
MQTVHCTHFNWNYRCNTSEQVYFIIIFTYGPLTKCDDPSDETLEGVVVFDEEGVLVVDDDGVVCNNEAEADGRRGVTTRSLVGTLGCTAGCNNIANVLNENSYQKLEYEGLMLTV